VDPVDPDPVDPDSYPDPQHCRKPNWAIEFLRFTGIFIFCLYLTVGS
jgi:hypothetical protein